jgi:hypothetical protein
MKQIFNLNDFDLNKSFNSLEIKCQPYELNDITDEIIYLMNSLQFFYNYDNDFWINEKSGVKIYQDDMICDIMRSFETWKLSVINLSYEEQQSVIKNHIWFNVSIRLWNEDNDLTQDHSFITQYPSESDIYTSVTEIHDEISDNLKEFGGEFDYFEINKVEKLG